MEPAEAPVMPQLLRDLADFVKRLPIQQALVWKRVRIMVTVEELEQFREYHRQINSERFFRAVRGVPLEIDPDPTNPTFITDPDFKRER